MEQLKQVLKYQFWILLSIALILPFVGWMMGTSGMISEAAARSKTLTDLKNSLKAVPDDPNGEWTRQLDIVNAEQAKQRDIAWWVLYERQKPEMVWPENMVEPDKMENYHLEIYRRTAYARELKRVRKIVNPLDDDSPKGLILFPEELLPDFTEEWKYQSPNSKQIQAAQEDIWLLSAILGCVAKVNEGVQTAFDAPIRQIVNLLLRGGSPKGGSSPSAPKAAASPSTGGGPDMKSMTMGMGMMRSGGMGGKEGQSRDGGGVADPKIDADEDLGPERPAKDSTAAGDSKAVTPAPSGGTSGAAGMPKGMMESMAKGMSGGMGGTTVRAGGANMERYCDENKEWKTRGFELNVVMVQSRVPDLLVTLSNCDWPINILRVHIADFNSEDLVSAEGAGGKSSGSGRSGYPSGGSSGVPGMGSPAGMSKSMMSGMSSATSGRSGAGKTPPSSKVPPSRSSDETGESSLSSARSTLEDPNLVNVAIVGVIYIFNKPDAPPVAPETQTPAEGQPAVAGAATDDNAGVAAASADGDEPAASTADAKKSATEADDKPDAAADDEEASEKSDEMPEEKGAAPDGSGVPATKSKSKDTPEVEPQPDSSS